MDDRVKAMVASMKTQFDRVRTPVTEEVDRWEVWLPTPDGAKLHTIVFQPKQVTGPYCTVIWRSCYYGFREFLEAQAEEYAKRGFAAVIQWCRGIGQSEGEWAPYVYERRDGLVLVQWLQEQQWCLNMGLEGASYLALTGWYIADQLPSKVKTMYLTVMGAENHTSIWQEGSFRQDIYTYWSMGNTGKEIKADYMTSARYRPQISVDEDLWGCHLDWYRDEVGRPSRLDPFWSDSFWGEVQKVPPKMNIPVFIGEGWYDIHLGNALKTYDNLSEDSKAHTVVQIMPGNHDLNPVIYGQPRQEQAAIDQYEQKMCWFVELLMEEKLPDPVIHCYIIGEDKWRSYAKFPPVPKQTLEFYLDGDNLAQMPGGDGAREYDYDPEDPVPSHGGGTIFSQFDKVGSILQPEPNWRPDVLSYLSEPLTEDSTIVGPVKAKLWVQSSAPDTCFTLKLMEVHPDGSVYNIRNGITTLGFRNDADVWQSYPGGPIEITIKTWDIAWQVKKGMRLRLDISSSNFPEYSAHPNTDKGWAYEENPQVAHQWILSGKNYPSKLILPLDDEISKE